MINFNFPSRSAEELQQRTRNTIDSATLGRAKEIVDSVEARGLDAVLEHAAALDGWTNSRPWFYDQSDCQMALERIDAATRADLVGMAGTITNFAQSQRTAIQPIDIKVPGGRAGHQLVPVDSAGCYAPAGRAPLPSSLMMGVIPARVAGVRSVWAASPNPGDLMLAAAAISNADGVLAVGGAQAIAAMAFGVGPIPSSAVVAGPGNRWVTAAKQLLVGRIGIDMLAGPSELVVLADSGADPAVVAADLLAQAEHDCDVLPILISIGGELVTAVQSELALQLAALPDPEVAIAALANGGIVVVSDVSKGIEAVALIAPEHLQLSLAKAEAVAARISNAGAVFIGEQSAEVFADYGVGPNHVLPTGGGARFGAGLSVATFLRQRTWLKLDQPGVISPLTARLARIEGLEAHARAAEARIRQ